MAAEQQPTDLDTACAQRLYDYTNTPGMVEKYGMQEIHQLRQDLIAHYKKTGMYTHQPLRAKYNVLRGALRASGGPLLHALEIEHDVYIQDLLAAGKPLALQDGADVRWQNRLFDHYGTYNERELHFLRASGYFINQTIKRLVSAAFNENHWCAPLIDLYRYNLLELQPTMHQAHPEDKRSFGEEWLGRFRALMISSNVTVLEVLAPAAHHLPLWGGKEKSSEELLRDHVPELATVSSMNREVKERYFGGQHRQALLPKRCPFQHDERVIAETGKVLNIPSLKNKAWRANRMCPENMVLNSPHYVKVGPVMGAEIRLRSSIPVAAETLWAT